MAYKRKPKKGETYNIFQTGCLLIVVVSSATISVSLVIMFIAVILNALGVES